MLLHLKWGKLATFEKYFYHYLKCGTNFTIWKTTSQCYNSLDMCISVKIPCYCICPGGRGEKKKRHVITVTIFLNFSIAFLYYTNVACLYVSIL